MDNLDRLIAFEQGELDEDGTIALLQNLIDTGMAWSLQGSYGRTARDLLAAGLCEATTEVSRRVLARAAQ